MTVRKIKISDVRRKTLFRELAAALEAQAELEKIEQQREHDEQEKPRGR
jgi:hypothetical protein